MENTRKMNFIDYISDYMSKSSRLSDGYGEVILRLLERCELNSRKALQDPTSDNTEALHYAEEFCALTELIYTFGSATAAYYDIKKQYGSVAAAVNSFKDTTDDDDGNNNSN